MWQFKGDGTVEIQGLTPFTYKADGSEISFSLAIPDHPLEMKYRMNLSAKKMTLEKTSTDPFEVPPPFAKSISLTR